MTNIKTVVYGIFLLLFSFHSDAQSAKTKFSLKDLKYCWELKDMVYEQNGGKYTNEEAQKLSGRIICFDRDTIDLLGDTIVRARYSIRKEPTKAFTVRNFQVFMDIPKWFKITADSLFVIKLNGVYITSNPGYQIHEIPTDYELAYDGNYLYLNDGNGELFRLVRSVSPVKKNVGSGSTVKEFALTGKEHDLDFNYEFYTDPDEIEILDQNGKQLYHSKMKSTTQEQNVIVRLIKVTKLTVKITSKESHSRWAFWFDAK